MTSFFCGFRRTVQQSPTNAQPPLKTQTFARRSARPSPRSLHQRAYYEHPRHFQLFKNRACRHWFSGTQNVLTGWRPEGAHPIPIYLSYRGSAPASEVSGADMISVCGATPFVSASPLPHAEAVLFVGNHQPEVGNCTLSYNTACVLNTICALSAAMFRSRAAGRRSAAVSSLMLTSASASTFIAFQMLSASTQWAPSSRIDNRFSRRYIA